MMKNKADTDKKQFTYMQAPAPGTDRNGEWRYENPDRWICHDPDEHFAGEFKTEEEAAAATERWNTRGGYLVTVDWTPGRTDAGWDRGVYTVILDGSRWRKTTAGTFGMEKA